MVNLKLKYSSPPPIKNVELLGRVQKLLIFVYKRVNSDNIESPHCLSKLSNERPLQDQGSTEALNRCLNHTPFRNKGFGWGICGLESSMYSYKMYISTKVMES